MRCKFTTVATKISIEPKSTNYKIGLYIEDEIASRAVLLVYNHTNYSVDRYLLDTISNETVSNNGSHDFNLSGEYGSLKDVTDGAEWDNITKIVLESLRNIIVYDHDTLSPKYKINPIDELGMIDRNNLEHHLICFSYLITLPHRPVDMFGPSICTIAELAGTGGGTLRINFQSTIGTIYPRDISIQKIVSVYHYDKPAVHPNIGDDGVFEIYTRIIFTNISEKKYTMHSCYIEAEEGV